MEPNPEESAIDEALEGAPRAGELKAMRRVLEERLAGWREELTLERDEKRRAILQRDIKKMSEQVQALAEEAEITQFVEDAVRVGIEMRKLGS